MHANSVGAGSHQTFELISLGHGEIAIRTSDGNHFLSVGNGTIDATATSVTTAETFRLIDLATTGSATDRLAQVAGIVGEYGTVTGLTHEEQTITLQHAYVNPVVIAGPPSFDGGDAVAVRVYGIDSIRDPLTDVVSTSFKIKLQESLNLNNIHTTESVSYFVIEAGRHVLPDGTVIEAGTVQTAGLATWDLNDGERAIFGDYVDVPFVRGFDSSPLVFSQIQTFNDTSDVGRYAHTVQSNVDTTGVRVAIERNEGQNNEDVATTFDTSEFQANGTAQLTTDNIIRLTLSSANASGSAWTTRNVSSANQFSFSTSMTLNVYSPSGGSDSDGVGGDGMAFVIHSGSTSLLGGSGGALGLPSTSTPFIAVEFDNFKGGDYDRTDAPPTHIGIDTSNNGSVASVAVTRYNGRSQGWDLRYAWIDYDGVSEQMDVYFSDFNSKPVTPTLSQSINLHEIFGSSLSSLTVGFTAGTGSADKHS